MPVVLAQGYAADHGAIEDCPEHGLWLAVIHQALVDLGDGRPEVRQDAIALFEGSDLLRVMDYAGVDRDHAPRLRTIAKELAEASPGSPSPFRKLARKITWQGQTRTVTEWSRVVGMQAQSIFHRLSKGWPVEQALTTPVRRPYGCNPASL